jgi:hypothetical protein
MTIKRNGDKVILKDGKVSCGCCCLTVGEWVCPGFYDATEQEYNDWRRGGILDFNISFTATGLYPGSVSGSGSIEIPPKSCVVYWSNGAQFPNNQIEFQYGFLKKTNGGYAIVYGSTASVSEGAAIQIMEGATYTENGSCKCATPVAGPFNPQTLVSGRGYCPRFDMVGATGGEIPPSIIANIVYTPN